MKINITTKNITLDSPIKVFIEEKVQSLEKLLPKGDYVFRVEVGRPSKHHKKGDVFYAEINIKIGKNLLRANAKHIDLRSAIVDVKDELKVQISKLKTKMEDKTRKPARTTKSAKSRK